MLCPPNTNATKSVPNYLGLNCYKRVDPVNLRDKLGGTAVPQVYGVVLVLKARLGVSANFFINEFMKQSIEVQRHSLAHIMASAIQQLWPEAKFGVGPVIDNGFYYDVEVAGVVINDNDLKKIEKQMYSIINKKTDFVVNEKTIDEAISFFEDKNQTYKVELLNDLKSKGTTKLESNEQEVVPEGASNITIYQTGEFYDLCRGPHISNTSEISSAFKLHKLAGAYWRGKEGNPMLTRIYGLVFETEAELQQYLKTLEQAKARDHRKLGVELDLFTFSDLVGSGLPLWTPKGTLLRNILDDFVWQLRSQRGYQQVDIPHITKKDLYEKSGHWDKFKDELFKINTREGHEFAMKPMNCPHHTQIFARKKWSYRELPQRYANTTKVYRDEQTGELSGLSRVRSITQDDAHVFCRPNQAAEEAGKIWDIIQTFYSAAGFKLSVRLSLHDPAKPEKYLGSTENWTSAEEQLRQLIISRVGNEFVEALGEAAFYGPKIDFMAKDSLGRQWQVATIQLDMNLPQRFDLTYVTEQGTEEHVIMLHAAIMGSIERYLSVVIEHFGGNFPLWLSTTQIAIISVNENHSQYCQQLWTKLQENNLRAELFLENETLGSKIRKVAGQKIPYTIVIGDKEVAGENLNIRIRGQEQAWTGSSEEFISHCTKLIKDKSLEL